MKLKKNSIERALLATTGFLMPCQIIAYKVIPMFIIPLLMYYSLSTLKRNGVKVRIVGSVLMGITIINFGVGMLGSLPHGWKESSRNQIIQFIVLVFILFMQVSKEDISDLFKGLRYGIKLNIVWAYLQYACFFVFNININDIVFNKILGIREQASTLNITENTFCITGLNWHPSQLIPIIILAYLIYNSVKMKAVLLVLAYISTNTTCMFTIVLCILLEKEIIEFFRPKHINGKVLISFIIGIFVVATAFVYLSYTSEIEMIFNRLNGIIGRFQSVFTGNNVSNSTSLHLRYYTKYFEIMKIFGLKAVLFGIGFDCSGYPFSKFYHQYASMKSWRVESDVMNFLIGRGLIWTIVYYSLLIIILLKGKRINRKYYVMIICFIISGILYNNQVLWVEALMMFTYIAIEEKTDVLANKSDNFMHHILGILPIKL